MKPQKRPLGPTRAVVGPLPKVFLVGDRRDWSPELEALLTREGYATDRLGDLEAVVPVVESSAVQALLVVARPLGASDLLIVRRIREASPRTGVVVVTTTPTSPDLKRAFESGATAFLSWPASREALRQALESGGGKAGVLPGPTADRDVGVSDLAHGAARARSRETRGGNHK